MNDEEPEVLDEEDQEQEVENGEEQEEELCEEQEEEQGEEMEEERGEEMEEEHGEEQEEEIEEEELVVCEPPGSREAAFELAAGRQQRDQVMYLAGNVISSCYCVSVSCGACSCNVRCQSSHC